MIDQKKHEWLMEYLSISPDTTFIMTRNDQQLMSNNMAIPVPPTEVDGPQDLLNKFPFCAIIGKEQPELCGRGASPEQALELLITILQAPIDAFENKSEIDFEND